MLFHVIDLSFPQLVMNVFFRPNRHFFKQMLVASRVNVGEVIFHGSVVWIQRTPVEEEWGILVQDFVYFKQPHSSFLQKVLNAIKISTRIKKCKWCHVLKTTMNLFFIKKQIFHIIRLENKYNSTFCTNYIRVQRINSTSQAILSLSTFLTSYFQR